MVKHLYLMRHGQTLFNVRRKIQGWCDSPLTELGIKQAEAACLCLKDIAFDHYYSSTSERCCDTLEIVKNNDMPYTRLKGLKERNFGTYEGESEDLHPPFEYFDTYYPLHGGETFPQIADRMLKTLTEVMEKEDHQCVLAVSHSGACMTFYKLFGDYEELRNNGGITNCCIFHYEYDGKTFSCVEVIRPEI